MFGPVPQSLLGHRFGNTVPVSYSLRRFPSVRRGGWNCMCDCGVMHWVDGRALRSGRVSRCEECSVDMKTRHSAARRREHRWPEYNVWCTMKQRCENPNSTKWKDYGRRGIAVCVRWQKFENFIADMGRRPSGRHSIDRINNNGDYEPGNCRWATAKEQAHNRRRAKSRELPERAVAWPA